MERKKRRLVITVPHATSKMAKGLYLLVDMTPGQHKMSIVCYEAIAIILQCCKTRFTAAFYVTDQLKDKPAELVTFFTLKVATFQLPLESKSLYLSNAHRHFTSSQCPEQMDYVLFKHNKFKDISVILFCYYYRTPWKHVCQHFLVSANNRCCQIIKAGHSLECLAVRCVAALGNCSQERSRAREKPCHLAPRQHFSHGGMET